MLFGIECLADAGVMDLCNGRNSMNLLVRPYGGALCVGRNSMNILVRFRGGASLYIIR